MSGQHTQGRLVVRGQPDMPNALYVADDPRNQIVSEGATPPDARRLAACWNACEGIDTDMLNPDMLIDALMQGTDLAAESIKMARDLDAARALLREVIEPERAYAFLGDDLLDRIRTLLEPKL